MKKNSAWSFTFTAFAISWVLWLSLALLSHLGILHYNQPLGMVMFTLGGFGPIAAAFIIKGRTKQERKQLRAEIFKFRLGLGWYAYAVLIPFILNSIAWLVDFITKGDVAYINSPIYMLLLYIPVMLIMGGIEEPGWRGVLVPELLKKHSLPVTIVISSIIWALWHYPLWLIQGTSQYGSSFIIFALNILPISVGLTILYVNTRSVWLCALFHSIFNSTLSILVVQYIGIKTGLGGIETQVAADIGLKFLIALVVYIYFRKNTAMAVVKNFKLSA